MIEIKDLCKSMDKKDILKDINAKIDKSSICGLLGPNGSGKTTLIKIMMGLWQGDSGSVLFDNTNIANTPSLRECVAYVSDEVNIPTSYTVKEVMKFYQLGYKNFDKNYFLESCKAYDLQLNNKIKNFSKGMKALLSIFLNLSVKPQYLILDEPLNGLDPIVSGDVLKLLLSEVADRGTTILISSHHISEIEGICDSVIILEHGIVKKASSVDDLKQSYNKIQVIFSDSVPKNLNLPEGIINVKPSDRSLQCIISNNHKNIYDYFYSLGATSIETLMIDLKEIFVNVIGGVSDE